MDEQTKGQMQKVRGLIEKGDYAKARKALFIINHPKAREWETRLDELEARQAAKSGKKAPQKQERNATTYILNLAIALAVALLLGVGALWYFGGDRLTFVPGVGPRPLVTDPATVDRPADQRFLFIGNSFTFYNDLDAMAGELAAAAVPAWNDVLVARSTAGGRQVHQHLSDAQNPEHPLNQFLVSGSDTLRDWDLVVIQGQSQISGLNNQHPQKIELLEAIPELVRLADNVDATPMLMMTWGYADGDPTIPGYGDYLGMQREVWAGYDDLAMVSAQSRMNLDVYVAPAGLGFQAVYEDINNPLANSSTFRRLYDGDMRHPGLPGSYLAANIVVASYTGQRMAGVPYVPEGLNPETAAYLRSMADEVVFGTRFGSRAYPWG